MQRPSRCAISILFLWLLAITSTLALVERARSAQAGDDQPAHRLLARIPPQLLSGDGNVIRVGKNRRIKTPSQAAMIAKDGDFIAIDPGTYRADTAYWPQNRIMIAAAGGPVADGFAAADPNTYAPVVLDSEGENASGKAIWVIAGDDVIVEGITFLGARAADLNGAGIRSEGTNLAVRNCRFFDNQMGLLSNPNPDSEIVIDDSEFARNWVDYHRTGHLGHNIYIGSIRRFVLRNSSVHNAKIGHNVKSRAAENYLLYNRVVDGENASSYLIDLPDGGDAYIIGNVLRQRPHYENLTMISFASESNRQANDYRVHIVNNTFINDAAVGLLIKNSGQSTINAVNNLVVGAGVLIGGRGSAANNFSATRNEFFHPSGDDFRLLPDSEAIDRGISPGSAANGFSLWPRAQYTYPQPSMVRPDDGILDVGAFEWSASNSARQQ